MTTESPPLGALSSEAFATRPHPIDVPLNPSARAKRPAREAEPPRDVAPPVAANDGDSANGHTDVFAATLLDDDANTPSQNALRLLTGAVGTMLLQVATDFSIHDQSLSDRLAGPPGLALAAAASLAIGLPGTLILLTALGAQPSFHKAYGAILRGYGQIGLLAGGLAPAVALFALTGGGLGLVSALSFIVYATAGTVATLGLVRRVVASAGGLSVKSFAAGVGFVTFTLAVGTYLWLKLMEAIVR